MMGIDKPTWRKPVPRFRPGSSLRALLANQAGSTFLFFGIALPMVLGMAGLGFDATIWYMTRRQNQSVADNASLAGMMALSRAGGTLSEATSAAVDAAARHGFVTDTTRRILVSQQATCAGGTVNNCLEILIEEDRPLYLTSFVMSDNTMTVQARAVGGIVTFGEHCVLALDESMDKAIEINGTANATLNCGIASNSSSDQAIYIDGVADLSADPAQAYGDIYEGSNATLTSNTPPQPLSERIADPYYDRIEGTYTGTPLIPPVSGACKSSDQPVKITADQTLSPNYPSGDIKAYCGGLSIMAGVTVALDPGVYVIDDGDFFVSGTATVTGVGVTIILTAWDPATKTNKVGNFMISGGADVTLSAPTTGDYAGLLFIQDPNAPNSYVAAPEFNQLIGGAAMSLSGTIYTPTRETQFAGNTAGGAGSDCTQIVAKQVTLMGTTYLENDASACAAAGVDVITQTRVRMVE